jgi:hypothetical protein
VNPIWSIIDWTMSALVTAMRFSRLLKVVREEWTKATSQKETSLSINYGC